MKRISIVGLLALASGLNACAADFDEWSEDESAEPGSELVGEQAEELSLSAGLDPEERAFLGLINDYRAKNGLGALKASAAASCAADFHSRDMAAKNYFSHTLASGVSWSQNMTNFGYSYDTTRGENLAAGNAAAAQTFTQWKNSPGHDANMKNAAFKVIGIARAYGASSTYKYYWTTDFGGYVDEVFGTPWLKNRGFESTITTSTSSYGSLRSLKAWRAYSSSGAAPARSSTAARSGSYGLKLVNPANGRANAAQLMASTPRRSYRLTAWSRKLSGSATQSMWVDFLDANYATISQISGKSTTSSSWTKLSATGKSPSGTKYVRVVLGRGATNAGSSYTWDDVTLDTICPNDGSAAIPSP
jgi:hypothetical protein